MDERDRSKNERELIDRIEWFLENEFWTHPEVIVALDQLDRIATEHGLDWDELMEFDVDYDRLTNTIGVIFRKSFYGDVPDEVYEQIADWRAVIQDVISRELWKLIEKYGADPEILNEL